MQKTDSFSQLKEKRTLLVDDDVLIRDSLGLVFKARNCALRACETAEEGLQALAADHYDIIISDLKLPGMDGLEFFRKTAVDHPDTPRVMITAYGDRDTYSEAMQIGVDEFIEKPFSVKALIASLSMMVAKTREEGGHPQNGEILASREVTQ
jgi:DNA-binding NtrC family response regulator